MTASSGVGREARDTDAPNGTIDAVDRDPFSLTESDLRAPSPSPFAFDGDRWVRPDVPVAAGGWRRAVWRVTGGRVNPGPSASERRVRGWMEEIRRPFGGARTVAVVSTKGGVGKTTTALNLGHTLASIRGDRVVALDANPDAGSLGHRVPSGTTETASDLLREADFVVSYDDVRHFTSRAASRLEVVASDSDPAATRRLARADYERLLNVLRVHYNLVVADCGTGILDAATRGVVQHSDQLVLVTSPSLDSARSISYLLDWLREHGMARLVEGAVVVINGVRDGRQGLDLGAMTAHFEERVRAVRTVGWDAELANGTEVELDWLARSTRQDYARLASAVVDGLINEGGTTHGE